MTDDYIPDLCDRCGRAVAIKMVDSTEGGEEISEAVCLGCAE